MKSKHRDPKTLTFSQAHGYEEMPQLLKLEGLSKVARTKIWDVFFASLNSDGAHCLLDGEEWEFDGLDIHDRMYYGLQNWDQILRDKHLQLDNLPLDEWSEPLLFSDAQDKLRQLVMTSPFHKVFDLVQFVLRHPSCPTGLVDDLRKAFKKGMLAYIIDDNGPPTIFPACTTEEGRSLTESLNTLQQGGLSAAEDFLRGASTAIHRGDWAGSIKNSVDAAESVARTLVPRAQTFGAALNKLKKSPALWHPQLVRAMENVWTYTNQAGIRHGSPERKDENVGQEEALFMLGTCASIASYLWRKHADGECA